MGTAYYIAGIIGTFLIPGAFWGLGIILARKTAGWVFWGIGDVLYGLMMVGCFGEYMARDFQNGREFYQDLIIGIFLLVLSFLLILLRRKKAAGAKAETHDEGSETTSL